MISEIANTELTSEARDNDIQFSGNFFQDPKNVEIIKTAINNTDEVKNNFLYYSDKIECIPSIVHFSGFNVNTTQKQFIRIVNKGTKKIRINVQPPESPYFTIEHKKKGYIIPQMSEDVLISFKPDQWKYYYDTIKIMGPDINVVVPIHGYPVLTDIDFPKRINFGQVPLAYTKTKTIPIKCNIPIDFEYKIEITEPNPFYNIYPLKGIIPAMNSVDIVIEYKPCSYRSSHLTFQIEISQFNFKPYKVKVFGTCQPNLLLDKTNELIKKVYGKKENRYGNENNEENDYDMSRGLNDNSEAIVNENTYLNRSVNIEDNNENTITIPINKEANVSTGQEESSENPNTNTNANDNTNDNDNENENNNNNEDINNNDDNDNNENEDNEGDDIDIDDNNEIDNISEEQLIKKNSFNTQKQLNFSKSTVSTNTDKNKKNSKKNNKKNGQDEIDLFISNFKKRKQYEKYKEMHRFICVGEDIPELDTEDDESNKIATIPDVLEKEPEINYETVKKSENILVGHDINEYYFFENDNYKKDWESKERIVKKFLRLHYKNIYQIRAKKLLDNFKKWKANNNDELEDYGKKSTSVLDNRNSFSEAIFAPINEQEKEYINKLNKNDESMKLFLPHSIIFDESHPFRKPYTINPIEINHIPLWNPIPFQEPLEYQLLNYQPQPDISISEYLFSNINQNVVDKTEEIKLNKRKKQYYIPEMPNKIIESSFVPLEIYNPHQYARNSICYWNSKINKNLEFEMFKTPTDSLETLSQDSNIKKLSTSILYVSRNMIQNEDVQVSFFLDNKLCIEQSDIEKHPELVKKIWKDIRDETKEREERRERKRLNKIKSLNRYKKLQNSHPEFDNNEEDESNNGINIHKNENELIEDISNIIDFGYCKEFLSFLYE